MEQTVLKKMTRFVELSTKFSKTESELFPKTNNSYGNFNPVAGSLSISDGHFTNQVSFNINGKELYVNESGQVMAKDRKGLTRGEKIEAEAKAISLLSDDFDEYNKLKHELSSYLSALNKINE